MSEPTTPLPTGRPTDRPSGPTGGRHPVDVTHLVMGVAFLALTVVWALITAEVIDGDDLPWVLPIPWILAGVGGLLAVTLRQRRQS